MIRRAIAVCLLLFAGLVLRVQAQVPKIDYASYLGGSGNEWGYSVTTDANGNIYVAGYTDSADLPLVNPLQRAYGGGTGDLFIAKLMADGSGFAYITYIGGSGGEGDPGGYVGGIAVDAQGNAYVAGITRSSDFPTTAGAYQTSIASQFACDDDPNAGLCGDAFVLKLSPAGDHLIYSTYLGGSDYDDARAIAIDSTGAAYITGTTASVDFPVTSGAFQSQLRDVDAYVAKLSADGSKLLYSTLVGGTGLDAGMAIAVDAQGRAYVAGTTQAADFPVKQALRPNFGGQWDAFVVRMNATGSDLDFSTLLGGQGSDEALGIALGPAGDAFVAGFTASPDFPVSGAVQPKFGGEGNGFVTRLKGDGSAIVYSTFLGGADGRSQLNAITVDAAGSAHVAGQGGSDFPIVNSAQEYGGGSDAVVAKLTSDGSGLLYSSFVGGSAADVASGIALDSAGRLVVTGQTASPDFPFRANAFQSSLQGSTDAFIMRLSPVAVSTAIFSSPKLLPIGETYVRQVSASQSLTVTNPGSKPLTVTGMTPSVNVRVSSTCATVQPGAKCSIAASLIAAALDDQSGTIVVFDNAPDSPQTIYVRGTGVNGGDLELTSVVAGSSFLSSGKMTLPITATVVNHGPGDASEVSVSVSSGAGPSSCNPCSLGTIKAGSSAVARFNFVPATYGMQSLTVQAQASEATPDVNPANNSLTVAVANPRYSANPAQLSFNPQTIGLSSGPHTITFTSLDQKPLQLSFSATGDYLATSACDPGALRCYAYVAFAPTAAGTRTGSLVVTEALAGTTQAIALTGAGQLAPHLKLSDTQFMFVAGVTGSLTAPRILTLTNDGSATLFLDQIGMTGNFAETNLCAVSLPPGGSCNILVSFMTAQPGGVSGALIVYSNSPELFDVVTLGGMGVPLLIPERPSRSSSPPASPSSPTTTTPTVVPAAPIARPERPVVHPPDHLNLAPVSPVRTWPEFIAFPITLRCDPCEPPECSRCKQE